MNWWCKVNSIQEACAKCFAVHKLRFEILQTTWKNNTENIKTLEVLMKNWKLRVWCSLFHFFHVICKISNFNMWTAKHLAQASCIELTLILLQFQDRKRKSSPPSLRNWRSKRTLEDETSIQIRTRHCSNRGCKNFCFLNLFVLKTLIGQSKVWTMWKSEL